MNPFTWSPGDWALHFILSACFAIIYISRVPLRGRFSEELHITVSWIIVLSPAIWAIVAYFTLGIPDDGTTTTPAQ